MGRHNALTGFTLIALVGLGVSACSTADDSGSSAEFAPQLSADAPADEASTLVRPESAGDTSTGQAPDVAPPIGKALATTAGVVVATSDIRTAVADTLTTVQRNGATVFTADVSIGDEREDGSIDGSGYFVVKVPPAALEPLIADLGATVGRLSGRTQETADVTDQLVDLDIRIDVERDVIARFQSLLGEATEFQNIVEIQRVISERTISLEQLLASQRNLDNRVERSTLTIQLRYEAPMLEAADDDSTGSIADAWRAGWNVFIGTLLAIGFVLAVAAPFVLTAALLFGVSWLVTRQLRGAGRNGRTAPHVPATPAATEAGPGADDDAITSDERLVGPTPRG